MDDDEGFVLEEVETIIKQVGLLLFNHCALVLNLSEQFIIHLPGNPHLLPTILHCCGEWVHSQSKVT